MRPAPKVPPTPTPHRTSHMASRNLFAASTLAQVRCRRPCTPVPLRLCVLTWVRRPSLPWLAQAPLVQFKAGKLKHQPVPGTNKLAMTADPRKGLLAVVKVRGCPQRCARPAVAPILLAVVQGPDQNLYLQWRDRTRSSAIEHVRSPLPVPCLHASLVSVAFTAPTCLPVLRLCRSSASRLTAPHSPRCDCRVVGPLLCCSCMCWWGGEPGAILRAQIDTGRSADRCYRLKFRDAAAPLFFFWMQV